MTSCNSHMKMNVHPCRGHFNRDTDPLHTPSCSIIPHEYGAGLLKFQSCFHYSSVYLANVLPAHSSYHFFNPLNAELNPTCRLLALLGVHHILHVSRIRVKLGQMFICDMLPSRCQLGHGTRKWCARKSVSYLLARSLIKVETSLRVM
jgi:hypothetical protein